ARIRSQSAVPPATCRRGRGRLVCATRPERSEPVASAAMNSSETQVTAILNAVSRRDEAAAEELLPIVYEELRRLAAARMARENPGQTLQATALVHEAYLRLVGANRHWNGRGHF